MLLEWREGTEAINCASATDLTTVLMFSSSSESGARLYCGTQRSCQKGGGVAVIMNVFKWQRSFTLTLTFTLNSWTSLCSNPSHFQAENSRIHLRFLGSSELCKVTPVLFLFFVSFVFPHRKINICCKYKP